jgi:hypothetical protein
MTQFAPRPSRKTERLEFVPDPIELAPAMTECGGVWKLWP